MNAFNIKILKVLFFFYFKELHLTLHFKCVTFAVFCRNLGGKLLSLEEILSSMRANFLMTQLK